jgi:hypothetical protein
MSEVLTGAGLIPTTRHETIRALLTKTLNALPEETN